MKNKTANIGMFIDGNYLLHTSNYYNYIHKKHKRLNIGGITKFIRNQVAEDCGIEFKDALLVESHYFRGRLNAPDANQRGPQLYNDRVFDDILMSEGISAHYLPLRNFCGKKEERGIDVWLSLEALELALTKKLDYVALLISDTDYVPLARKLMSYGIKVILLSWEFEYISDNQKMVTKTSQELLNIVSMPINMCKIIDEAQTGGVEYAQDLLIIQHSHIDAYSEDDGEECIEDDFDFANDSNLTTPNENGIEVSDILSIKQKYGFIRFPNNNLFFHSHDVDGEFSELQAGDMVEFTIGKNSDGEDVAKSIKKIVATSNEVQEIANDESTDYNEIFYNWGSNE